MILFQLNHLVQWITPICKLERKMLRCCTHQIPEWNMSLNLSKFSSVKQVVIIQTARPIEVCATRTIYFTLGKLPWKNLPLNIGRYSFNLILKFVFLHSPIRSSSDEIIISSSNTIFFPTNCNNALVKKSGWLTSQTINLGHKVSQITYDGQSIFSRLLAIYCSWFGGNEMLLEPVYRKRFFRLAAAVVWTK